MELIHHHFESLPSTNDWAKAHVESFDVKSLTLVTADAQTAGRGQYGRHWISPPKVNLYMTLCFFTEQEFESYALTHLLAVTVAQMLQYLPCHIKWPNDLMIGNKKIAGILCETLPLSTTQATILGLGLNVNMPAQELAAINQPATSLFHETGSTHDLPTLMFDIVSQFSANLTLFYQKGFAPFESAFRTLLTPPSE